MSDSTGQAANNIQRSISSLIVFIRWVTAILIALGTISLCSGVYCAFSGHRFWFGCVVPLGVCGILLIILGIRASKLGWSIQKFKIRLDEDALSRAVSRDIQGVVPAMRKLVNIMTIGLAAGICIVITTCVLKWPFLLGFGTALTLQSGLIAAGLMLIIFRCEIHLHEIERGERPS